MSTASSHKLAREPWYAGAMPSRTRHLTQLGLLLGALLTSRASLAEDAERCTAVAATLLTRRLATFEVATPPKLRGQVEVVQAWVAGSPTQLRFSQPDGSPRLPAVCAGEATCLLAGVPLTNANGQLTSLVILPALSVAPDRCANLLSELGPGVVPYAIQAAAKTSMTSRSKVSASSRGR